jgi:hypothetical protein
VDWGQLALLISAIGGFLTGATSIVLAYLNRKAEAADEDAIARKANFDELRDLYHQVRDERDEYRKRLREAEDEFDSWRR